MPSWQGLDRLRLQRLTLTNFRNYAALSWRPSARITVLHGPNGSGKTNLLEAISLLVPGRGLRNARSTDLPRLDGPGTWAVAGQLQTVSGDVTVGTGTLAAAADRRIFRLDGVVPRSHADIAEHVAAVWLTPQMDRLFQEGLSGRRRFLDRLVWALEPQHARQMAAHDTAVSSRNRLLAQDRLDPAWLSGLEESIARHAVAASAARLELVTRLNGTQTGHTVGAFPQATAALACPIAERLQTESALAVEDWLRHGLESSRRNDRNSGTSSLGAHRTDFILIDRETGVSAALASTGQQKALLMGIILAHTHLIASARGFAPFLLLDEPAVHLDQTRRCALWRVLADLPAQVVLTGTDGDLALPLADQADAFVTGGGILKPDRRFLCGKTDTASVTDTG